jgi:hypothetical protein
LNTAAGFLVEERDYLWSEKGKFVQDVTKNFQGLFHLKICR